MTGPQLKAWRQKHGLSQNGLARLLHVTATSIYRWETGRHRLPDHFALLIRLLPAPSIATYRR